jgi:hypothetical protein
MNFFAIYALGESFDIEAYLPTTPLVFTETWRRGDQRSTSCLPSFYETSGVQIALGEGSTTPFMDQERIALEYLKRHRAELFALGRFPGVQSFALGMQYHVLNRRIISFCLGPSAQLMHHALEIGLAPTYYVTFDYHGGFGTAGGLAALSS